MTCREQLVATGYQTGHQTSRDFARLDTFVYFSLFATSQRLVCAQCSPVVCATLTVTVVCLKTWGQFVRGLFKKDSQVTEDAGTESGNLAIIIIIIVVVC